MLTKEGFRLLWFHSRSKQTSDAATRATRLQRAIRDLTAQRERLVSPRTRFRLREKVAEAVDAILDEHLKTDFRVAPVYLQNVERIVGLLAVYFFALMVQSLLERELRKAMSESHLAELPLYPEGRPCSRPTTRRVLDYFAPLSSHTLTTSPLSSSTTITTELTPLHRRILQLLGIPTTVYDQ